MLALNRALSQGHVNSNDVISGSEPMVLSDVSNNISEMNGTKEVKSEKACIFPQFSNETRAGNVR